MAHPAASICGRTTDGPGTALRFARARCVDPWLTAWAGGPRRRRPRPSRRPTGPTWSARPAGTTPSASWRSMCPSGSMLGVGFFDCTFRGARFNGSTFRDVAFANRTFIDCGFFDVRFRCWKLFGAMSMAAGWGAPCGRWRLVARRDPGADLRSRHSRTSGCARPRPRTARQARRRDPSGNRPSVGRLCSTPPPSSRRTCAGSDLSALDPRDAASCRRTPSIDVEQALVIATPWGCGSVARPWLVTERSNSPRRARPDQARLPTAELTAAEIAAVCGTCCWRRSRWPTRASTEAYRGTPSGRRPCRPGPRPIRLAAHASVVERDLHVGRTGSNRTGYVEAVAVDPSRQGSGLETQVMHEIDADRGADELGVLGTLRPPFLRTPRVAGRRGPLSVRVPTMANRRTREEEGDIPCWRYRAWPRLDLTRRLSCEWRPGDVW